MLYDNLSDILKHTHALGFIEIVKVFGEEDKTKLEAMSKEKTVIFTGELNDAIPELDEHTVGLGRMGILDGYVKFPTFKENANLIAILEEERNTPSGPTKIPTEIKFSSPNGHSSNYRFMGEAVVNNNVNVPPFKGADWKIEHEPTEKNLKDLQYFSGILSTYEGTFNVIIKNGNMSLGVGSDGNDQAVIPFASGITESMPDTFRWPLAEVISILKLQGDSKMFFDPRGLLKIEVDSGLGKYKYMLPART